MHTLNRGIFRHAVTQGAVDVSLLYETCLFLNNAEVSLQVRDQQRL